MTKEEITIPRWLLERIEDTLRIQYNINLDKKTGETCQDRNIKESLNGVRKLLKGEELTGGERLERLQPSLPSDLDEAAEEYSSPWYGAKGIANESFKAGSEWMAGQGKILTSQVRVSAMGQAYLPPEYIYLGGLDAKEGDKVIVQIRKA